MKTMKNLAISLCVLGGMYTSGASAEVVQDCVLSGEVVSVNQQSSEKMRVRFHKMEHGELANCNLKGRAKRGRVDADITMEGLELPKARRLPMPSSRHGQKPIGSCSVFSALFC